jgi:threonine dehydratase
VVGVVAEGAPAMALSWRANRVVETDTTSTIADGIAVRAPIPVALDDMRGVVDDIVMVSDQEIVDAMKLLHAHAGLVTEPAGAAGLAAATPLRASLIGKRVGVIVTGGNASADHLAMLAGQLRSKSAR